jgi:3-methyladenine DNA glycosylase AlkD
MNEIDGLIQKVEKVKDGFKPLQVEAEAILVHRSLQESLQVAHQLYTSDVYQARMLATIIFGRHAADSPETFSFLRHTVSHDDNWRVQEMLAMAFDTYCKALGYEKALPTIKEWLSDSNHNVKRAVSEGLRIWTHRDYFKQHPDLAIQLLSSLKADEHEYVRKSVGNALRDISRFHKDLVEAELKTWDTSNKKVAYTYSLASKFLTR